MESILMENSPQVKFKILIEGIEKGMGRQPVSCDF